MEALPTQWKNYLELKDYEYLSQFIENIKNDIPNKNNSILLVGIEKTGKSKLVSEIKSYLTGIGIKCYCSDNKDTFEVLTYLGNSKIGETNCLTKYQEHSSKKINMTHVFS